MGILKLCFAIICLLFIQIEADETDGANRTCPNDSLPCNDGECVGRGKWCDGVNNCQDESDEAYCIRRGWWTGDNPNNCRNDRHFLCANGTCIPVAGRCDGFEDCKDKSDEWNCEPEIFDDYEDYMTSTVVPTETTTIELSFESDEFGNDDIATTAQSSSHLVFTQGVPLPSSTGSFYAKRMEQGSIQTGLPPSSKSSTTTTKAFSVTDPITSQWSSSNRILTSTWPTFDSRWPYQGGYHSGSGPIQSSTSSYYSPYTRNHYQHPTQIPYSTYLDGRRTPSFQSQIRPTIPHYTRREPYNYPTQPSISSSSRSVNQNYPAREVYEHEILTANEAMTKTSVTPTEKTDCVDHESSQVQHGGPLGSSKIKTEMSEEEKRLETALNFFRLFVEKPEKDESSAFCELLGIQLKEMDTDTRQAAMYEINRVIFHLKRERYIQHITAPLRRTRAQPLTVSTATPVFFYGKLKAPSRFYFAKNYTRMYLHENAEYIEKGRDWILSTRHSEGGWGKETPRALIALSLINNSFANATYENNILKNHLEDFMVTSMIRDDTKTTSVNRLATSVNALIATCQNPRDFHGTDYTELIRNRLREQLRRNKGRRNRVQSVNPFVYLALCLADRNLESHEVHDLITRLQSPDSTDEFEQDKQTMAITAFTCHLQLQKAIHAASSEYQRTMDSLLSNATSKLLQRMHYDGSFGSVYSTAIAAQALISVNDTKDWNSELTFNFLREHQKEDGSFGDILATYLVLPVLSGRSLLHLRNTQCTPPNSDKALTPTEILRYRGPKHHVRYSLFIGNPKTNGYSMEVHVPEGISFFDIMRVAAHKNDAFRFSYEERDGGIHVYSISNVPNDSERGLEWSLFATGRSITEVDKPETLEPILMDIRRFNPRSDLHVIFWYKPRDERT